MLKPSKLSLQDGSSFWGISFGFSQSVSGEVVFNTGMVGYPETFTDPSYKGQILVLTYPLVGNYGVPSSDAESGLSRNFESGKIQISGLIISDYSFNHSHWGSVKSLSEWLIKNKIPALYNVDTRALTKKLREKGTMLGKLVINKDISLYDPNNENLVDQVSINKPLTYKRGELKLVVVDCGIKNSIIRSFLKRSVTVIRVPWNYDFLNKADDFDGIVISNGPGDPKMCTETIENIRQAMKEKIPVMGICLGNQILALAAGADTYKLKYGHRSQNQPCIQNGTKRCFITSQNHGYAVKTNTLPRDWKPWFTNVNDKTNEGIIHKNLPFMSVQFHPEANPGPVDTEFLFDNFLNILRRKK